MSDFNKTLHLRIEGWVQGVYYRQSALEFANSLGVCGWVRNKKDGSVELLATGDEEKIDALYDWCRIGPKGANVTAVEIYDDKDVSLLPTITQEFRKEKTV